MGINVGHWRRCLSYHTTLPVFLKELFVAALYTTGVLLPSVAVTNSSLTLFHIVLMLQFGALAFTNLLMFSWFDSEQDNKHKQHSFVTALGKRVAFTFIWILLMLNFAVG